MDERATDKAEAWQKNCMAILGNGEIAVCIKPGPWHGWLFEKHPDGQWVSVEKLQTGPMTPEGHPLATLSAIPAAQGEHLIAASDTIRTLLSRIEELESAAALAGKIAIEEAAKWHDERAQKIAAEHPGIQGSNSQKRRRNHHLKSAAAIRSLSKPLDRNALIERGARAVRAAMPEMFGSPEALADPARVERFNKSSDEMARKYARAILSAWIGEETK